MTNVKLSDIENVSFSDLSGVKLHALENSADSFDYQLNHSANPIALSKANGTPYTIINGRHRVYTARQKGYSSVSVVFV